MPPRRQERQGTRQVSFAMLPNEAWRDSWHLGALAASLVRQPRPDREREDLRLVRLELAHGEAEVERERRREDGDLDPEAEPDRDPEVVDVEVVEVALDVARVAEEDAAEEVGAPLGRVGLVEARDDREAVLGRA